jgi:hypothetical protein
VLVAYEVFSRLLSYLAVAAITQQVLGFDVEFTASDHA